MKSIINFYDKLQNRPSYKFFLNIFSIKEIYYFSIKQIYYIQIFFKIINYLKIKIFKFNYNLYNYFIVFFIVINIILQLILIIL
jgi:hypothetical protein